jgi:glycosyltransferase involved in cell wall biosynthesis
MKLLIAHATWYPTGGDWTYLESIKELYEKNGSAIVPFSMHHSQNHDSSYSKYFVSNVDYKNAHKNRNIKNISQVITRSIYSSEAVSQISKLLREQRIDIVQLNNVHNVQTLSIIPVIKKLNIPIVWRVLDYKILCPNRTFLSGSKICKKCIAGNYCWATIKRCKKNSLSASFISTIEAYFNKYKKYYDMVDVFLLQSEFSRRLFIEAGFPESKLRVIGNPYVSSYNGSSFKLSDGSTDNYILYFGRLSSEKGVHTLIKALDDMPEVSLYIIGDGPERTSLEKLASCYSFGRIKFLGEIWGAELDSIVNGCELTVCPSEWYEVSPYSILQSLGLGKPVVGANIGGIPDLITDGYNGRLFESGNHNSLSTAVKYILNDQKTDYQKNCKDYIAKSHCPQNYYDKTMKIFKDLL